MVELTNWRAETAHGNAFDGKRRDDDPVVCLMALIARMNSQVATEAIRILVYSVSSAPARTTRDHRYAHIATLARSPKGEQDCQLPNIRRQRAIVREL